MIKEENALGEITTYAYDILGHKIAETLPNGNAIITEYDADERIIRIQDNLGYYMNIPIIEMIENLQS